MEPLPRHQESSGGGCGLFHISSGEVGDAHDHGAGFTRQRTFGRGDPAGERVIIIAARWYQGDASHLAIAEELAGNVINWKAAI
jgi:hypothetical protein